MKVLRQGDVLLLEIAQLPEEITATSSTLAEGEITGHHHIAYDCEVVEDKWNDKFVISKGAAVLKHQDTFNGHKPTNDHYDIPIPAGIYAVIKQRQYNPLNPNSNPYVKD